MYRQIKLERYTLILAALIASLFFVSTFIFMSESVAKEGYDVNIMVNNSTMESNWRADQSTEILSFQAEGLCTGNGSYSKYLRISGFVGMGLKENTHTNEGRLINKNDVKVVSDKRWINFIDIVNNSEHYVGEINESLPTVMYSNEDLYYRGDGIYTNNKYVNKEEGIYTKYRASRLIKSVKYGSAYVGSLISANVTPDRVQELILRNSTTAFKLASDSDQYSELGYRSKDECLEETYFGPFIMDNKIIIKRDYGISDEQNWLSCCYSERDSQLLKYEV